MDDETERPARRAPVDRTPYPEVRKGPGKLQKIVVGGGVSLLVLTVMYGPNSAFQALALSVICTAGIGLIPMLFIFWLVGGIVLHVVGSIRQSRSAQTAT